MKVKVTFDTRDFADALVKLGGMVPSKVALPIMSDILLSYDRQTNMFSMTASDTESWVTMKCVNRDGEPFAHMIEPDQKDPFESVCLPYRDLKEAVTKLPKMGILQVCFTADTAHSNGQYEVVYGTNLDDDDENRRQGGRFSLPYDSSVEFPLPPTVITREGVQQGEQGMGQATPVCRFTVDAAKLLDPMKQARVCCASDELRPIMNGECLDVYHDRIVVVSTNGHSLYRQSLDLGVGYLGYGEFAAGQSATLIVPKGVLSTVADTMQQGSITVTADTQRIEWHTESVSIVCRQIEGRYPNYNSVIPQDNPVRIGCDRRDLMGALRRVSLFASDSSELVKISIKGQGMELTAEDYDFSKQATERVALSEADGAEGFAIGFKCSTLLSLLGCIETEGVIILLSDASRAFLLREDDTNSSKVLLCMPMLLNEA